MSWLFGSNKGANLPPPQFPLPPIPPDGGDKGGNEGNKSKMDAYRFDSAALERAAKAAKELEATSQFCKHFMELPLPLFIGRIHIDTFYGYDEILNLCVLEGVIAITQGYTTTK